MALLKRSAYFASVFVLLAAPVAHAAAPDFAPCCTQAAASGSYEIDLSWVKIGDPNPAITGYRIERESPVGGGFATLVANTGSAAVTYADKNLAPGATYNYRVYALNGDGMSPVSVSAAATTAPIASTAVPGQTKGVSAKAGSATEIDLSWSAPASDSAIIGYRIERSSGGGADFSTIVDNTNSTATSYSDKGLAPGATYGYRISAWNAYGPGPTSMPIEQATASWPSAPYNLSAVASDGSAQLSWSVPVNTGGGLTGYTVTNVTTGSSTSAGLATSTVVSGLTNGVDYMFTVSASSIAGASLPSAAVTVTPHAAPAPAPTSSAPAPIAPSIPSSTPPVATISVSYSSNYLFTYLLLLGSRGAAVTELQKRLTQEGVYSGPITGYFGPLTQAGVKAYQKAHGINTTGMVGILTRAQLNAGR